MNLNNLKKKNNNKRVRVRVRVNKVKKKIGLKNKKKQELLCLRKGGNWYGLVFFKWALVCK